ncbi:MAG TPA: cyclophilin-like fold protein [Syntrophobacteria bacterium]|nr:cyclophilin-like fold protein [Syntrophobacteria bacterium]
MKRILIKAGTVEVAAELNSSPTAAAIWQELPITGSANTWGEEIYFRIPVSCDLESTARDVLELGELGYWPPGRALCIFFGKTPISAPGEIRAASAVTVVGRVLGDPKRFLRVRDGDAVGLEAVPG